MVSSTSGGEQTSGGGLGRALPPEASEHSGAQPAGANALTPRPRFRHVGSDEVAGPASSGGRLPATTSAARLGERSVREACAEPVGVGSRRAISSSLRDPPRAATPAARVAAARLAPSPLPNRLACASRSTLRSSDAPIDPASCLAPIDQAPLVAVAEREARKPGAQGPVIATLSASPPVACASPAVALAPAAPSSGWAAGTGCSTCGGWSMFHGFDCPNAPILAPQRVHITTEPSMDAVSSTSRRRTISTCTIT
eukprot:scaffold1922_cov101-Isochrysis_galbana.AAC.3